MKRKRHSEETIIKAIKQYESGVKVADICRELGIVEQTFYKWKAKFGGMEVSEAKRLRELEEENARLNNWGQSTISAYIRNNWVDWGQSTIFAYIRNNCALTPIFRSPEHI